MYFLRNTSLLADLFKNFGNMYLEIYELDPARFLTAPGLAWQAALRNTEVKLDLLIDIDMLLMVKEGLWGRICHAIYRYAEANNKYMKDYNKNKESSYHKYLDVNNLYGCAMSQKLSANDFKWVEDISELDNIFLKGYNEESDKGYFLEVDIQYLENLHNFTVI